MKSTKMMEEKKDARSTSLRHGRRGERASEIRLDDYADQSHSQKHSCECSTSCLWIYYRIISLVADDGLVLVLTNHPSHLDATLQSTRAAQHEIDNFSSNGHVHSTSSSTSNSLDSHCQKITCVPNLKQLLRYVLSL